MSIWSFYGNHDLEGKMRLAAQSGFGGLEIDLTEDGPLTFQSTAEDFQKIRGMAEKAGVRLSGLATGLYWGANPASADAATRDRARTIIARQIECAEALGIDAVLVVPGTVGVDFIPGCEVVDYDVAWERAKEFIGGMVPAAERAGVKLCIENVWNKFLLSPLEMARFIDGFGSTSVASYFDVGNALACGYPEQWIRILGSRISRVHFKDYRRNVGSVDVALALEAALMGSLSRGTRFRTLMYLMTSKDLWVAHFVRWKAREAVWTPGMILEYAVALQRVVEE